MKRLILSIIAFLTLAVSIIYAQDITVKQPDVCFVCHAEFEDLGKLPHVHTAFADGQCSDCHNPHATSHAALLNSEATQLCVECHEDMKYDINSGLVHDPAGKGECLSCHDPHASQNPDELTQPLDSLCRSCHGPVAEWVKNPYVHAPVAADECLACHAAHKGEAPGLLEKAVPALCFGCHEQNAGFAKAHQGYNLVNADCVTCHDPHASTLAPLLMPNQHAPFRGKKCETCHADNSRDSFALRDKVGALCYRCHGAVRMAMEQGYGHSFNDDESCLHCHNPHASSQPSLLAGPQAVICTKCHFQGEKYAGMSADLILTHEGMDCTVCHMPHGSDSEYFLAENNLDLCGGCHEQAHKTSHPIGPDIIDPRDGQAVTCLSCHQLHGAEFKPYLPLNPAMDLCLQCHRK